MNGDAARLLKEFYRHKSLKSFVKGETILPPDNEGLPLISYIETGIVEQYDISPSGEKIVLNILKPGSFFPAASAVNHTFNRYYFEATAPTNVRQATADEIEQLLQTTPAIVYDLLKRLYRGVDGILQKLSSSLALTARERILNELTIHAKRFGTDETTDSITIRITTEQIAHQTGLARETVSRELQILKSEDIVTTTRGEISLHKKYFVI